MRILNVLLILAFSACNGIKQNNDEVNINDIAEPVIKESTVSDINNTTKTIKNQQVGPVNIGDDLRSTIEFYEKKSFKVIFDSVEICGECPEKYEYLYNVSNKQGKLLFAIYFIETGKIMKISRIEVSSLEYITDRGIRVGDKVKDLREKYNIIEVYFEIGKGVFLFVEDFNGSFKVETNKESDLNYNTNEFDTDSIPDNLKINNIVVI